MNMIFVNKTVSALNTGNRMNKFRTCWQKHLEFNLTQLEFPNYTLKTIKFANSAKCVVEHSIFRFTNPLKVASSEV